MSRILALHAGTHKTGTKTIQTFLSVNRTLLAQAGIYYPRAGRVEFSPGQFSPGHHAFAWEVAGNGESGPVDALIAEITAAAHPLSVVSSEDLGPVYASPARFERLANSFASARITAIPVLYLRRQDDYAESLYGEYAKAAFVGSFDRFIEQIIADGAYHPAPAAPWIAFDYAPVVETLQAAFENRAIVRGFEPAVDPLALVKDFLNVLARLHGPLTLSGLQNPLPRANERMTLRALLATIGTALGEDQLPEGPRDVLDRPFALLTHGESIRFLARFGDGNAELVRRFGVTLDFHDPSHVRPPDDPTWADAQAQRAILRRAFELWGDR